jgi:glycosyltransferase involved in cell wall biosynthesis
MSKSKVHIALLIMAKNEHLRLHVTLESVLGHVDSIVMYDTGSEDDTIEIASSFCKKHDIIFRLKQGEFVDFSTSRNVSLDFADTFEDIDFILLMDTNDELRGGDKLRKFCQEQIHKDDTSYLLAQEWWCGQYIKYYNTRLIKSRQGWRYSGKVHEWMRNTLDKIDNKILAPSDIILYQDRTADDDKSSKRFERDEILLLEDHKENPKEARTVFYLAQTYSCLKKFEDSLKYYELRSTMEGFWEENFQSLLKCGELSQLLGHDWFDSMRWYIKAFEHTSRVEPLLKIAEYYKDKNWFLCYSFAKMACNLEYPKNCILFVDKQSYEYKRWHLLGIAGWYAGFYEDGKNACKKAIEAGVSLELDTVNLKFYEEKEEKDRQILKEKLKSKNKNKSKRK